MRVATSSFLKIIKSNIHAGETKASANMWVGRPDTPLVEDRFLEKQEVLSANISCVSIAACHPLLMRNATELYIGYIESGEIKIVKADYNEEMKLHKWSEVEYTAEADDMCLCFDGTMPKSKSGEVEFITESTPWVFWIKDGVLFGQKTDEEEIVRLVESGCTAVTAIRAMWSSVGGYDFGLVVFFIIDGKLFYKQLINGEWYEQEIVTFGPKNVSWQDVAAFRTWDYRIGVQAKTTDGNIYELFTQFMGIGKQNAEHIHVDIAAKGEISEVNVKEGSFAEHIEVNISAGSPHGGLYSILPPAIISAENLENENGDWGTIVKIKFDNYIVPANVANNAGQFSLIDSMNMTFIASEALIQEDEKTIILKFMDFNNARGTCKIQYQPGNLASIAGVNVELVNKDFVPINLVPSALPVPEVEMIWNT